MTCGVLGRSQRYPPLDTQSNSLLKPRSSREFLFRKRNEEENTIRGNQNKRWGDPNPQQFYSASRSSMHNCIINISKGSDILDDLIYIYIYFNVVAKHELGVALNWRRSSCTVIADEVGVASPGTFDEKGVKPPGIIKDCKI